MHLAMIRDRPPGITVFLHGLGDLLVSLCLSFRTASLHSSCYTSRTDFKHILRQPWWENHPHLRIPPIDEEDLLGDACMVESKTVFKDDQDP